MNHRETPSGTPSERPSDRAGDGKTPKDGSDSLWSGPFDAEAALNEQDRNDHMMIESVGLRARVLAVSPRRSVRRRISSMLRGKVESLHFVESPSAALEAVHTDAADLVIIERALEKCDGIELLEKLTTHHPMMVGVVLGSIDCTEDAVRAMRAGACDLIPIASTGADTVRRITDAIERAERIRRHEARVDRLKKLCGKLNDAREEVTGQIGGLCTDLTEAYEDLTQQFGDVKIRSELETLFRQELDIESLLRTLLEFTLSKIGPTNAAVFMPTSGGDYSVGAYVNYDIAKETAEVMLDQLADSIPETVEHLDGVRAMSGRAELTEILGTSAYWIEDATLMTISCREDDECLAVLALFRDRSRPFGSEEVRMLEIIGSLFSHQLARVIQTHHRHLPRDEWGLSGDYGIDGPDDDQDFESFDEGYGFAA